LAYDSDVHNIKVGKSTFSLQAKHFTGFVGVLVNSLLTNAVLSGELCQVAFAADYLRKHGEFQDEGPAEVSVGGWRGEPFFQTGFIFHNVEGGGSNFTASDFSAPPCALAGAV
jgi:hypothetical protein